MLNASVGVRRVLTRLRPTHTDRTRAAVRFHRRSVDAAEAMRVRASSVAASAPGAPVRAATSVAAPIRRSIVARVAPEAALPMIVALIVAVASFLSWLPGVPARGAVGGPTGDGDAPRLAVGGAADRDGPAPRIAVGGAADRDAPLPNVQESDTASEPAQAAATSVDGGDLDLRRVDPEAAAARAAGSSGGTPAVSGPFLADGTLLKPIAVTTTVADGKDLLRSYKVTDGDSLTGIADRFGVSMMTVWWANDLKSKELKVGQTLVIPPVNGLVVTVKEGDTLDALAKTHEVAPDRIYETNGLEDRALVPGQTLILPGARGAAIPTPTPKPTKPPTQTTTRPGGATSVRPPTTYTGGAMVWPVVGGNNYISQYYHAGHRGIDIAADYGSKVRAAAGGTVIFAGWKNNGGGYQVHLSHGGGLYTTYNHMSGVSVGVGQHVSRGQQVGRIGATGYATGPHLHFDVWKGPIWNGGTRVNPLAYL